MPATYEISLGSPPPEPSTCSPPRRPPKLERHPRSEDPQDDEPPNPNGGRDRRSASADKGRSTEQTDARRGSGRIVRFQVRHGSVARNRIATRSFENRLLRNLGRSCRVGSLTRSRKLLFNLPNDATVELAIPRIIQPGSDLFEMLSFVTRMGAESRDQVCRVRDDLIPRWTHERQTQSKLSRQVVRTFRIEL